MSNYTIFVEKKKCLTPVCRGGYVNILESRALPDNPDGSPGKLAWGMQCMFPKDGEGVAEWVNDLKKIYVQVLLDKFGQEKAKEMAGILSKKRKFPLRDGDDPVDTDGLKNAEQLEGHYFLNTNNIFRQPYIIGPAGKRLDPDSLDADDIYSGAYYRVMLEFWYFDKKGNRGISTSIAAVMKIKDGANLGAGTTSSEAEGAFEGYAGEAASMFDEVAEEESDPTKGKKVDDTDDFDFM